MIKWVQQKERTITMRKVFSETSYEPSTDAYSAPEFSSAFLIRIMSDTAFAVSLFIISVIIFLQLILIRLIGIKENSVFEKHNGLCMTA
ncbi:MAG TPA: hypothetical protein DDY61_02380 [Ruminococcaceae bacterium]|nr:hypothetical protein [Oscillospiraceae bacterium]